MPKSFTVQDFIKQFPDDAACLNHLFETRFGKDVGCDRCGEVGKFKRLAKLPAYKGDNLNLPLKLLQINRYRII